MSDQPLADRAVAKIDAYHAKKLRREAARQEKAAWQDALARRGDGYAGDERNVLIALRNAPDLAGLTHYNEFTLTVEFRRQPPWRPEGAFFSVPWDETDDTGLQEWLQAQGIPVRGRSTVADSVAFEARERPYHPVRLYLDNLAWDGVPRLRVWLHEYVNATGDSGFLAAAGLRFMVSAVARILSPGCQADHVLVLEGPQGIGKSTTARTLAVRNQWFADSIPDVHDKDAKLQLIGRWVVELSELKGIRQSQTEAVKAFLSATTDTFRPPYGRRSAQFPRQCVFIATTNEDQYLRDRTGNRRYWPVRCGRVRLDELRHDCDQLWAEAVHEYRAGTQWHLTDQEVGLAQHEQGDRLYRSELEHDVANYLTAQAAANRTTVSVRDVLVYGLHLDPASPSYVEHARKAGAAVAEAMRLAGWQRTERTRAGTDGRGTFYQYAGAGQDGQEY